MINIDTIKEGSELTVKLEGDLDRTTAASTEERVLSELAGVEQLIIDFDKLAYISSAGLRVLVKLCKQMEGHGTMAVINADKSVADIISLSGLKDYLNVKEK
ncbi:MAG: STAS domain-containing protein [Oscillospiraceae bacterium]|nr:STAS domain-containing protein [Oscillospiraceae bacterium]